ncbi:protein bax [Budvicia diplopodorum]|uniref:protein bax n=1 Tax=Budvicia diplopodorum TaxID=1119056 RepID=UPI00135A9239|nr:protein bax [Budvicia diplopodorum]
MPSLVLKIMGSAIFLLSLSTSASWASTSTVFHQEYSRNGKLSDLPDLRQYPSGTQRKKAFLNAVVPIIDQQNRQIHAEREWLSKRRSSKNWNSQDLARVRQICDRYKVDCASNPDNINWDMLLKRVDIIPTHLVATQAATESGWGTSKLARTNKNIFGLRCGSKNCNSKSGAVQGYSTYSSINESVTAYMINMNTHSAYNTLRESRANLRSNGDTVTADHLINKLHGYSRLGSNYSNYLRKMLDSNHSLIRQAIDTASDES